MPKEAIIAEKNKLNADTMHFHIRLSKEKDRQGFDFDFGQFILLSIPGFGEIPLGICSSPDQKNTFEIAVKKAGTVTSELFKRTTGDRVGIRGPFGQGIRPADLKGKGVILISGGVGLVPLRSIIQYSLWHRKDFGKITLIYGAKNQYELLFSEEFKDWENKIDIHLTIDEESPNWRGKVGLVTDICNVKTMACSNSKALICGPPVMYKPVVEKLTELGMDASEIYLLLERKMKCGVGKCQHCVCGTKYVCQDGPVFTYEELKDIKGAI